MPNLPTRCVGRIYQLDANRINARRRDPAMNKLEQLKANGVVSLVMSDTAYAEAGRDGDARLQKTRDYTWIKYKDADDVDVDLRRRIEEVLFPEGAQNQNQRNDVDILFKAERLQHVLITSDGGSKRQPGGMLGNAAELAKLGVVVLSTEAAVSQITQLISERDAEVRRLAARQGLSLPEWVGADS